MSMQKVKNPESRFKRGQAQKATIFPAPRIYSLSNMPTETVSVKTFIQRYAQEKRDSQSSPTRMLRPYVPGSRMMLVQTKSQSVTAEPQTDPALIHKFKALVRKGYVSSLSPEQEHELNEIRTQIQSVSPLRAQTQKTIRQVQEMNTSLDRLEVQIEARIAQRRKEQQEKSG